MIPQFYQLHLEQQLQKSEYLTLKLLVDLLQCHKTVSIESLATLMPYPIKFESRLIGSENTEEKPKLKVGIY